MPVDEFEPSVEALAVREEIEHAAGHHAAKPKDDEAGDGDGDLAKKGEQEPPRPRLDLRG